MLNDALDEEVIQDGVIITNLGGRIEYVNDIFESMTLYKGRELQGTSIARLFVSEDEFNDRWKLIVDTLITKGSFELDDAVVRCSNETTISTKISLSVMVRPADKDFLIVFYVIDNGREISTDEELERIKKINIQLIQQADSLKQLNTLKSKFLGIASHELKTPLTSIKGYAEIIIDSMADTLTPQVLKMVTRIASAADRLHNVINDMLDVSRIEQNRLQLRPSDISLEEIVSEVVDDLFHFFTKRSIQPVLKISKNMPLFWGDRVRIHQVITNLISNAIKYSLDKTTVVISLFIDGDDFHIAVKDEGLGIADSEKENIFEPFYEISSTANHSTGGSKFMGGGTGLGLSIVKGIVESHGGRIWVESGGPNMPAALRGSEFHIKLPQESPLKEVEGCDGEVSPTLIYNSKDNVRTHIDIETEGDEKLKKIVIIDNDVEAIELCNVILGDHYNVVGIDNGEYAIKAALSADEKPDLILLNYYLPGLSGPQICKILKGLPETSDITLVFFTAATQQVEVDTCLSCGGDGFIVKPFSSRELVDKVEQFIQKR